MVLNTYFVNSDWLNWNTKWWRGYDADNPKLWRYTLWDMDNICNLGQNFSGWSTTDFDAQTICEVSELFGNDSWNSDVGHSSIYGKLVENESFFSEYINRYTDLLNGPLHCDALTALLDQFEADMLPEMQGQVDRWGGSLANWQDNVESIRQFNCDRYDFAYTVIQDCFPQLDGPYTVTVNVNGVGELLFSTTSVTDTFSGTYFGGIDIDLEAVETCGATFTGWNVVSGDAVLADPLSFTQNISLTSDLVIEGTFIPNNQPIDIFFDTDPTGFGGIMVDGTEITLPGTYTYTSASQIELTAIESGFEIFDDWEVEYNEIIGDDDDNTISINVCEFDTIIADFDVFISEPLTFNVIPAGAGTITAEGIIIPTYPTTEEYGLDINIDIEATPAGPEWQFVEWQLANNTLNPDQFSVIADFDFETTDVLVAVFELLPTFTVDIEFSDEDGGTVTVDGVDYFDGDQVQVVEFGTETFTAIPNEWYTFDGWLTSTGIVISGDDTDAINDFIINGNGTITAIFTYIPHWDVPIDVFPAGSGTINLDGTDLPSYPYTETFVVDDDLGLIASPIDEWWYFSHWEAAGQTFTPNNLSEAVTVSIQNGDAIVAVFIEIENYEITVQVEPAGAGIVTFSDNLNTLTTWTGQLEGGIPTPFNAMENPFYEFVGWKSAAHAVTPSADLMDVSYTFTQTDTVVAVFNRIEFALYVPSSFTPDQDGLNEVWKPRVMAANPDVYECIVFNRNGEIVFESNDPEIGWDGSHMKGDHYVPNGVYSFIIKTESIHELGAIEKSGQVTIFR